jgi:hypothetical protein
VRLVALLCMALLSAPGAAGAASPVPAKTELPSCFGPLTSVPLPENLGWARDIRFIGDQEVLVSAYGAGLVRLRLDRPGDVPRVEFPPGAPHTAAGSGWSFGLSEDFLAIAATHFAVGWKPRTPAGTWVEDYFESTADIDVQGNRVVLLGLRKTDDGRRYDQEGAYLWLGNLTEPNLDRLRPLAFSSDGSRASGMDACGPVGVGAVRFLADGSFVAIPLAEPGVALFGPDGRLATTWKNEEFGLDGTCHMTEEMLHRVSMSPKEQMRWINERRVVDEILPLPNGHFAVLVRSHEAGTTQWQFVFASSEGSLGKCDLPFTIDSPWVELNADIRGSRVVFVQSTRRHDLGVKAPQVTPRLLMGDLTLPATFARPPKEIS